MALTNRSSSVDALQLRCWGDLSPLNTNVKLYINKGIQMRKIIVLLIIAGAVYSLLKPANTADILLASENIAKVTNQSGIKIVESYGGMAFDVNELAVPGQVTVVDFYVSWCRGCRKLSADYKTFINVRPDVAIRRVKMKDKWNTLWAKKQYGLDIATTPHVLIFDSEGKVLVQDLGNNKQGLKMLYEWMNKEVRKG